MEPMEEAHRVLAELRLSGFTDDVAGPQPHLRPAAGVQHSSNVNAIHHNAATPPDGACGQPEAYDSETPAANAMSACGVAEEACKIPHLRIPADTPGLLLRCD